MSLRVYEKYVAYETNYLNETFYLVKKKKSVISTLPFSDEILYG